MRIGILGAGHIGGTLGKRWAERNHEIVFGVREPQDTKIQALVDTPGLHMRVGTITEAVAFGEVVLLAIPGAAVDEVIQQVSNWYGKVLIDATNRFISPTAGRRSSTEEVAQRASGARVVKAFNSAGFEILANPSFGDQHADTFLCGDDAEAKALVTALAVDIGMGAVDVGSLSSASLIDALTRMWGQITRSKGRGVAFKVLTRET